MNKNRNIVLLSLLALCLVLLAVVFIWNLLFPFNKKQMKVNNVIPTHVPAKPTIIKYPLLDTDFSGIRQKTSPEGVVKEVVGKVLQFDANTGKIQIGDKQIPFMYDTKISTQEAPIVKMVTLDKTDTVIYAASDKSKIVLGTKIIGRCQDEAIDPECSMVKEVYILIPFTP